MKKYLLIFFLMPLLFLEANAQTKYQYFDGADTVFNNSVNVFIPVDTTNIWHIGIPQKAIFNSASTVPNAILTDSTKFYPINNLSSFYVNILNDWFPWGIIALQWKQKLDMDLGNDGGIVEFSIDNGNSWQNAFNNPYVYNFYGFNNPNHVVLPNGEDAFSGMDTLWKDIWLCFDLSWMSQFPDTIRIKYSFISDSINNNREGWMMDNFISHITFIHTVNENETPRYLNVYPNPVKDIVFIEAKKIMEFHIIESMQLYSLEGKLIDSWKNIPTKFWFDTSKYANGQYILDIKTNLQSESLPITISH